MLLEWLRNALQPPGSRTGALSWDRRVVLGQARCPGTGAVCWGRVGATWSSREGGALWAREKAGAEEGRGAGGGWGGREPAGMDRHRRVHRTSLRCCYLAALPFLNLDLAIIDQNLRAGRCSGTAKQLCSAALKRWTALSNPPARHLFNCKDALQSSSAVRVRGAPGGSPPLAPPPAQSPCKRSHSSRTR